MRGRPTGRTFDKPVTIRLSPEDRDRLEQVAKDSGYSVPALVRACVTRGLSFVEDAARRKPRKQA